MRRAPCSLDLIGSPRLRHAKQRSLAPRVRKLSSNLDAINGVQPIRYDFAGRHPSSPDVRTSRTTAVSSLLTVSFRKALLGNHSHARLIALCCAGRSGHQSRFDNPAGAVWGIGGHDKVWGTKAKPLAAYRRRLCCLRSSPPAA